MHAMAADIEAFRKLLQLIEQHPELREELRRYVLTEELLRLPAVVQQHGERLTRLEVAVQELTAAVRELVPLTGRHDERFREVERELAELRQAVQTLIEQRRVDNERLARLEEIAARQEERLARLEEIAARQEQQLAQHDERLARLEEIAARQEERLARLEEIAARQEERLARLEEIAARQEERLAQHDERLSRVEAELDALRQAMQRLTEAVEKLVRKTAEHDRRLDRLSSLYGAEVEARAAEQIVALHTAAGWQLLARPRILAVNGEFDVVARVHHPEHGTRWLLVEAKARLSPRDVIEFAGKLQREKVRRAFRTAGISGTVSPYLFGRTIDSRVDAVAAAHGVGLIDNWGEAVAPRPIEIE
jgi:DNA repair exonuclease SbcCD ATPase subunit